MSFILKDARSCARIYVNGASSEALAAAIADFRSDIRKITGATPRLLRKCPQENAVILEIAPERFPKDAWENFTVSSETRNILRIVGSDERGVIFGIYEFIEKFLGVDPLHLWTGTPYPKHNLLQWNKIDIINVNPDFKFRGIFINDEDLLTGWKIGGKREMDFYPFYSTVIHETTAEMLAETFVRLRYNMVIPASFVNIQNPDEEMLVKVFSRRGLFITMHHVEPLGVSAFGFKDYWKKHGKEYPYSYIQSHEQLLEVWRASITKWKQYHNIIWQLGLRGIADNPIWATDKSVPADDKSRADLINRAIAEQISLLEEVLGERPRYMTTTLWYEGSYLNRQGLLKLPDDVIEVYADNCAGWRMQDDFRDAPIRHDVRRGAYLHQAVILGTHLAQALPPSKMQEVLSEIQAKGANDYIIFNCSNVREFIFGIGAAAEMTHCLISFMPDEYLHRWVSRHFSRCREKIAELYKCYFNAFEKNERGVAFFTDGLLEWNAYILLDILEKRQDIFAVGTPAINELMQDMFVFIDDPKCRHAALLRQETAMRSVLEEAKECHLTLLRQEKSLLYAQMVYPAMLICSMTAHDRLLLEACFALSRNDTYTLRKSIDNAIAELQELKRAIPEYTSGKFRNWYADCRKVNLSALLNRTKACNIT